MKSIEFIKNKLEELYSFHSYLEIKYEYRLYLNTHIIEVKPVHCFNSDKEYIFKQIDLEDQFQILFPEEEILFITTNDLIQIERPILELGVSSITVNGFSEDLLYQEFTVSEFHVDILPEPFDFPYIEFYAPPLVEGNSKEKDSEYYSGSFFLFNIVLWNRKKLLLSL